MKRLVLFTTLTCTPVLGQFGVLRRVRDAARRLMSSTAGSTGLGNPMAGFVATGERSLAQETEGFPTLGAVGPGWSCSPGEDPATSCCDAVPKILDIFNGTACQAHFGVVALALGMSNPPLSASIPSSTADISSSLDSFCPSACAHAVAAVVDDYRTRSPLSRLCPMVQDGLWRLSIMCEQDATTGPAGQPVSGSSYCLPMYATVYRAFDEVHAPVTESQLKTMCGSPCATKLVAASVAQAATLTRAAPDTDTSDAAQLARYAARRTTAMSKMINILCSKDPNDSAFCVLKTNILARPDQSLGAPSLTALPPHRALSLPGSPFAGDFAAPTIKRLLGLGARGAGPGRAGRVLQSSDGGGDDQLGTLLDSDDFTTAMNPIKRFKWACSSCGRAILYGLMDLAEIFGMASPAGEGSPELTPDAIRELVDTGCGEHTASNRTCLQMLAQATPASARYDPSLGTATMGVALCADFARQVMSGVEQGDCPAACSYALQQAKSVFGCCLPAYVEMAGATGRSPISSVNATAFALAAEQRCGVPGIAKGKCHATMRRFVATRLSNIKYAWLNDNADRIKAFGQGWTRDLAAAAAISPSALSIHSIQDDPSGGVVVITSIAAPSDDTSISTVASAQQVTSAGSVPLVDTVTAVAADPGYTPQAALSDVTTPIAVSDVSASYAPAPETLTDTAPAGASAARVGMGATLALGMAAVAVYRT